MPFSLIGNVTRLGGQIELTGLLLLRKSLLSDSVAF